MNFLVCILLLLLNLGFSCPGAYPHSCIAEDEESILLKSWADSTGKGLKLAWSRDGEKWQEIGDDIVFLASDFGSWNGGKKMYGASLSQAQDGMWVCRFNATKTGTVTGVAKSADLIHWTPQEYEAGGVQDGADVHEISATFLAALEEHACRIQGASMLDERKLSDLSAPESLNLRISVSSENPKEISTSLYGIFFEDINNSADGGLYAQLIRNYDFEFSASDKRGWTPTKAWTLEGDAQIHTDSPIHGNNSHYLHVKGKASLQNDGWDGICVEKGQAFNLSLFSRGKARARVSLISADGKVLASENMRLGSKTWEKKSVRMLAKADCDSSLFRIELLDGADCDLDMISLFPEKTFKGHGLREDIAQALAALHPSFVRFPGGCVAHGNGVDNIYDWKGSIGPLEQRKPLRNLWGYHQTRGLGYYEYFQFCEDIGAMPLPVLAAGVPCQNSDRPSHHTHDDITRYGQQGGIPMQEMDAYINDILDLVEYANGPADSEWGSKRALAGHPQPFGLKYIGIGNEDLISPVFKERFEMIFRAVRQRYPEICVIGTVGPFHSGSDYDSGWAFAQQLGVPMVDEHYYVSPSWMVENRNFYDSYDRNGPAVYLGEYAAHRKDIRSTMETALAEALYLTDVERNADIVRMTSYAPLLARKNWVQWEPDLIWFTSRDVSFTPSYYVQKLFGSNAGGLYLESVSEFEETLDAQQLKHFGVSCVVDVHSGETVLKIVNMLPSHISADISGIEGRVCKIFALTGQPEECETDYEESEYKPYDHKLELEPFSVNVIRIK